MRYLQEVNAHKKCNTGMSLLSVNTSYLGHYSPVLDQPVYNSVKRKYRKSRHEYNSSFVFAGPGYKFVFTPQNLIPHCKSN
jgi:hypothetical protein